MQFVAQCDLTDRRVNNNIALSNNDEWRQVVVDNMLYNT